MASFDRKYGSLLGGPLQELNDLVQQCDADLSVRATLQPRLSLARARVLNALEYDDQDGAVDPFMEQVLERTERLLAGKQFAA